VAEDGICDVDVDECASSPCENGATCSSEVNAYNCACIAGFANGACAYDFISAVASQCTVSTGGNCDVDVDECISDPCLNGAICTDSATANVNYDAYSCACLEGYANGLCGYAVIDAIMPFDGACNVAEGGTCDMDVDECMSLPCQNGAACSTEAGENLEPVPATGVSGLFTPIVETIAVHEEGGASTMTSLEGYTTYQLSIGLPPCAASPCVRNVYAMYGDEENAMLLPPAWMFGYDSGMGSGGGLLGQTETGPPSEAFIGAFPALEFTSFVTFGSLTTEQIGDGLVSEDPNMYAELNSGWHSDDELRVDDGAVFFMDPDVPNGDGSEITQSSEQILVAQLTIPTSTVVATAIISFQGRTDQIDPETGEYAIWELPGLHFQIGGSDVHDAYMCTCIEGFTNGVCGYSFIEEVASTCDLHAGHTCDVDVDECASSPCQNGTPCTDSTSGTGVAIDTYYCDCSSTEFEGSECDDSTGACVDTDFAVAAFDTNLNGCSWYDSSAPEMCGGMDDEDFTATAMCCACGGGE
jgi:Notch-like protein